jgi:inward rectifier potassium channel
MADGQDAARDPDQDLGFGAVVATESRLRLLNRDGTFNVARRGLSLRSSLNPYHSLLTISWLRFLGLVAAFYLLLNALFAVGYLLCGPDALAVEPGTAMEQPFLRAFFFSVETLSTVGYGHVVPAGLAAHLLMTLEAIVGLLTVALATGLVFARFSRPRASILFSEQAVVAPYRDFSALMFRIANRRKSQIIDLAAQVSLNRFEWDGDRLVRRFYSLALERARVTFFPLSWTIVHPIDAASPLAGVSREELLASDAEILVLLTGTDETFSQSVHARSSYKADEVVWDARFEDIFEHPEGPHPITIDIGRLGRVRRLGGE